MTYTIRERVNAISAHHGSNWNHPRKIERSIFDNGSRTDRLMRLVTAFGVCGGLAIVVYGVCKFFLKLSLSGIL